MLAVLPRSGWICRGCCRKLSAIQIHRRFITSQIESDQKDSQAPRTRNIGIIAHIDAGKTTTTERMLYYSGFTRRIGDVDDGSTVTDFLPAERARGITIQSAAVSFHWPPLPQDGATPPPVLDRPRSMIPHSINLIDTPGHADFTFEVLRALRILDGAVCILDGVAGVEAQTEKVWHQASLYNIPKIVYVNKLDRDGAAFGRTIKDIGSRLGGWPALCQIPWWEGGKGQFTGVGDVVGLRALKWEHGEDGKLVKVSSLETLTGSDTKFAEEIKKARIALVEILSEHDDDMVERYLEHNEDHLAIPAPDIIKSLRKCISNGSGTIIPVFAGASFRNIGVQPLLDAIVDLLPEPSERKHVEFSIDGAKTTSTEGIMESLTSLITHREPMTSTISPKNQKALSSKQKVTGLMSNLEACALAFKVVNDPRRGVLVYVRVYSGCINRNASLFNTSLQLTERAPRLLRMYASDAVEISSIPAGQIGVVVGLKYARTGDTLISYTGMNSKHPPPAPFNSLQLRPIDVPPPVFFASIEPQSLSEEKHLSESLSILLREDPSLHLAVDDDSGQTLLSGMGELHLEIAKDRLVGDFKAKATMGKIEIGYRECILAPSPAPVYHMFERDVGGKTGQAGCTADVSPLDPFLPALPEEGPNIENNCVKISIPSYDATGAAFDNTTTPPLPPHLNVPLITKSLQNGALAALSRGPYYGYPLHGVRVAITFTAEDIFGTLTTPTALTSAARAATSSALNAASGSNGSGSGIMEPVMNVTISVDEGSMGAVIHDISSSRGGQVLSLDSNSEDGDQPDRIDISKIYAPPDPFASTNESNSTTSAHLSSSPIISSSVMRNVRARVPLKEMVGYLKHLRSLSKGRGTFVMEFERFERVTGVREKRILEEKGRGF